jgi:hypothetical protein
VAEDGHWLGAATQYEKDIIDRTVEEGVVFEAKGRKGDYGAYVDVWVTGTDCDVTWDAAVSGCDNMGNDVTIQKCNGWILNDPVSCQKSESLPGDPEKNKWIACAIGSSPAGIAPGDSAVLCDGISDTFSCEGGKNCFLVTDVTLDESCKNFVQSGLDSFGGLTNIILMAVGGIVGSIVLYYLVRYFLSRRNSGSGSGGARVDINMRDR